MAVYEFPRYSLPPQSRILSWLIWKERVKEKNNSSWEQETRVSDAKEIIITTGRKMFSTGGPARRDSRGGGEHLKMFLHANQGRNVCTSTWDRSKSVFSFLRIRQEIPVRVSVALGRCDNIWLGTFNSLYG